MKTLENLKMNKAVSISYNEAAEIVQGSEFWGRFSDLHTEEIGGNCQNKTYTIEKIGKKGSVLYPGSTFETRADKGIFVITVKYDYIHPSNFCQNRYNTTQKITIEI